MDLLWMAKRITVSLLLCFESMMLSCEEPPAFAVKEYVETIGEDWNLLSTMVVQNKVPDHERYAREYQTNHDGIMNVKSAKVIDIVEVRYEDIIESFSYYDYVEGDKFYAVGFDADVYEDSKYFCSGIQYFIAAVRQENGQWKISEMRQIYEPKFLLEKGYDLNEQYYRIAIYMFEMRKRGYFFNGRFELYEDIHGNRYDK